MGCYPHIDGWRRQPADAVTQIVRYAAAFNQKPISQVNTPMAENRCITYLDVMTDASHKMMKLQLTLLVLLASGLGDSHAAPGSTNTASTNSILIVDPSSMPVAGGKVTLTIGTLRRANGVYSGDYKIKVFPYFFKNEKGKLAITVSDESLARINQGKFAAVIGTATTSGKNGVSRHIDATATPFNINRGTLKVRFAVGDRKMVFEPVYHFSGKMTAAVPAQPAETNPVSYLQRGIHISHNEALETAAMRP
jgi:hypothetical protein